MMIISLHKHIEFNRRRIDFFGIQKISLTQLNIQLKRNLDDRRVDKLI